MQMILGQKSEFVSSGEVAIAIGVFDGIISLLFIFMIRRSVYSLILFQYLNFSNKKIVYLNLRRKQEKTFY